jgi:hypothetical protein
MARGKFALKKPDRTFGSTRSIMIFFESLPPAFQIVAGDSNSCANDLANPVSNL